MSNDGGSTTGGIGFRASVYRDNFLFSANYRHDFGAAFQNSSGGDTNAVNVKGAYLVPLNEDFAVGPYLSYQYTRFTLNDPVGAFHYTNNAIGGGGYAAFHQGPLTVTGNVGYLSGVSATYSYTNGGYRQAFTSANGSANVLQLGMQADYQVSGPWYAFTGFKWDRYMHHGDFNLLQGNVGLGYSF
ncbi:hypothetical protein A5904_03820 [Acidithiobacillus caldus]|uniref:Outer membrane protein beta-barrel domain-containing protein n=3 Tax=Acidithiobacillus caldus TaxID=33059 RepID=F9ZKY6_ACICS|nr:conserved hypothetical protein [Acidithiobacillus caldus SM-1]AIA54724.1 hypothetical protein Acaty_c0847 [Acidithiobacillus caldus ATCC 51756]AUW32222.1 hypothetical protein A5904_03820 [Acidithiobacillus caldus]MCE5419513.1 hypothetical protein [Acidithiobacillus sp.]MBU2731070.1 hypothetical protein [Acidithiobacillus caldus]